MTDYKYLGNFPLFRELMEQELNLVHSIIHIKNFEAGSKIFEEGEAGQEMYILLEGEIEITKPLTLLKDKPGSREGDNMALIRLKAEEFPSVGEMALFGDNDQRSATVTVKRASRFGVIEKNGFLQLAEKNPALGYKVMRNLAHIMGERLKKANQDILKLTTAFTLALQE